MTLSAANGARLIDIVRALDEAGVEAVDATRRQVTLDDVFLTLTNTDARTGTDARSQEVSL